MITVDFYVVIAWSVFAVVVFVVVMRHMRRGKNIFTGLVDFFNELLMMWHKHKHR